MIVLDWVMYHPFFCYIILIPFFMVVFYLMDLYDEQKKNIDKEVDTDKCFDLFTNNFWPATFWLPMLVIILLCKFVFSPLSRLTIKIARRTK